MVVVRAKVKVRERRQARQAKSKKKNRYVIKVMNVLGLKCDQFLVLISGSEH